jgi:uncharacterized protein YabE (DUF348 family)
MMKIAAIVLAMLMLCAAFSGCAGKKVTVTVNDMGSTTEVETETGKTVSDALAEAKITLGEKDECDPAADEKITEDLKEITVKRYAKVTIIKDGQETAVEVVGGTVEDALKKAGITLAEGESADVDLKTAVKDGMTVTVGKEVKVSLTVDGKTNEITTKAATVQALLDEQGVTLGKDDELSEKADTKLADGMKIVIKRVEYKNETATEEIPYETEEQYSSSMAQGTSETTQSGVTGEKEVTYKVKYVDGKEADRETVSEKVTKEAVNEIITYGTYTAPQNSGSDSGSGGNSGGGRTVVSVVPVYDCDGSGHGYNEIHYSDGSVEYQEF